MPEATSENDTSSRLWLLIAAIGLTVALFVAGAAYLEPGLQGQAKMGALLSGGVAPVALLLGRLVVRDRGQASGAPSAGEGSAGKRPLPGEGS